MKVLKMTMVLEVLQMTMVLEVLKLLNMQELLKRKVHFSIMASWGAEGGYSSL